MKKYEINEKFEKFQISLSSSFTLVKYDDETDQQRMHEYRQKVNSICYSATVIKSNIIKTIRKLIEFLINLKFDHLIAANYCMRYLQNIKYLEIKYIAFDESELRFRLNANTSSKSSSTFYSLIRMIENRLKSTLSSCLKN
jgi:hypothetical protein